MSWRRLDTLFLRLFVLLWVILVAAHLVAYAVVMGQVAPGRAADVARLPILTSLPPGPPFEQPRGAMPPPPPPQRSDMPPPPAPPPGEPPGQPRGDGPPSLPPAMLWLDYGLRALVIAFGAALGARWLAAPMRRLAGASTALEAGLARGEPLPVLDERRGSAEMRETARVFNRMAVRLREQFDARGLQLAATSHDLRTPLTRLRLRLEPLPEAQRAAAARDIDEIDALLDDTLAVLREQRAGSAPQPIDALALLQALADDFAEQGEPVTLDDTLPPLLRVSARPAALRRGLVNLVHNALRHGGSARLSAQAGVGGFVELLVDDDGPGIPPEQLERVFEPWVQLAPGPEDGPRLGHGLGLAIARELAERDGGRLVLANRPGGGLRARLVLPVG
ncbi:HAMP domain-containing protein [Aquincola sp. S2]|uniref:histidine kinase n=1 Tax=Pseudaquabacterium terrae TaxID=2732868 RepID=A0ABX2EB41_9BURK|nr:ATP-binding protein [Aquabacterium terrae]NRF66304.1 HAMP domain-containing protein [Aquabacterium terrae]